MCTSLRRVSLHYCWIFVWWRANVTILLPNLMRAQSQNSRKRWADVIMTSAALSEMSQYFYSNPVWLPLMSLPKPMDEVTAWLLLLLLFSLRTSSSLDRSSRLNFFLFFFFLCRGGSFLGKVNMGKMTSSMATAHRRNPLHLDRRGGLKNKIFKIQESN